MNFVFSFLSIGGFSKVYVSMCDLYGCPHLEEVVWVCHDNYYAICVIAIKQ